MGFTFAGKHISAIRGVAMRSMNRNLKPALRKNTAEIPGRDGWLDFGGDTYAGRQISVQIGFAPGSFAELRQAARQVAGWLSGSGLLIFDDEPDKAYKAQVIGQIDLEQLRFFGAADVEFECQPFAEALGYDQLVTDVTTAPAEITLTNKGTQRCPCLIVIRNTGTTDIDGLILTSKSET